MIKKMFVLFVSIILCAISISFILRCDIGVGALDAFSQTSSELIDMKVGTFSMLMNIAFVAIQVLFQKKVHWTTLMQIVMSIVLGFTVNYFYYDVLRDASFGNYASTLLVYLAALSLCAFSVGTVTAQNFVAFPLEGLCLEIERHTNQSFGALRQMADVLCVVLTIVLVVFFKGKMTIREGTIIATVVFGPLLSLYMKKIKPWMIKIQVFE